MAIFGYLLVNADPFETLHVVFGDGVEAVFGVVFDDVVPDERRGFFEFEALVARELGAVIADGGERGGDGHPRRT